MTAARDFWSRRKAAVEAEEQAARAAEQARAAEAEQAALAEKSDAEILAELDLPDPDTLQPGDDVTRFLAQAVPDRLRRRALRRLWRLNPVLANVDGLVDYGEDFTDAACVMEGLQTAYQVGKGMLKHVEELAAQADPAPQAETLADPLADPQADPLAAVDTEIAEDTGTLPAPRDDRAPAEIAATRADAWPARAAPAQAPDDTAPQDPPPAPRRMRFQFEG